MAACGNFSGTDSSMAAETDNRVLALFDAVEASDITRTKQYLGELSGLGLWEPAVRKLTSLDPANEFRRKILPVWVESGDVLRDDINCDLVFIELTKVLLPRYVGGPVHLYRGESWFNRRRRSYGASWSADQQTARGFAQGFWRTFKGGSCLLETHAPSSAIVSVISGPDDAFEEQEYLVDRRRLTGVRVLERFGEETLEEHRYRVKQLTSSCR